MNEEKINILFENIDNIGSKIVNSLLYKRVPTVLFNRAVEKSADYVEKNMPNAIIITSNNRLDMWKCAISKIKNKGHISEFGVGAGYSINHLADLVYPKNIFGFDSFFGLEEDFLLDHPKGDFNLNGVIPEVKENVIITKGSFANTLPDWLNKNPGSFSFLNIDCNTYEATSTVLNAIGPDRIVSGTFILFDEYFGYHGWEKCEFKAWQEYCNKNNVKYRYIAVCHMQVLVEVV
jgi:hypothetical protein